MWGGDSGLGHSSSDRRKQDGLDAAMPEADHTPRTRPHHFLPRDLGHTTKPHQWVEANNRTHLILPLGRLTQEFAFTVLGQNGCFERNNVLPTGGEITECQSSGEPRELLSPHLPDEGSDEVTQQGQVPRSQVNTAHSFRIHSAHPTRVPGARKEGPGARGLVREAHRARRRPRKAWRAEKGGTRGALRA